MSKQLPKQRRWLKKGDVAERYSVVPRSVTNMVKDERLPPPSFPLGPNLPLWSEDELDALDRKATLERPPVKRQPQTTTA